MIRNIYCLKDVLTGFLTPVLNESDDVAKRAFLASCNQDTFNDLTANPQDFALYKIGSFDSDTGVITPIDPECICYGNKY